jgi:translation initiation factor 3 subunit C
LHKIAAKFQTGATAAPRPYIAILTELEDFAKTTQENKANVKMNALKLKAFNTMRQKIKKHNKQYEKEIEEYRKNPQKEEEEKEDGSDVEFEDEEDTFSKKTAGSDEEDEEEEPKEEDKEDKEKKAEEKKELKPEEVKAKVREILSERGKRVIFCSVLVFTFSRELILKNRWINFLLCYLMPRTPSSRLKSMFKLFPFSLT